VRLILDPAVRLHHGGRTLVAHGRVIRLSASGRHALRALLADTATPPQQRLGERLIDAGFAHPRPAPRAIAATTVIPVKDHPVPEVPEAVVVVDDGSTPPIPGAIRRACGGPAAARNTGVAHVSTPFVAFLDADATPPPDWIERLGGHFDDPRVAAVAPRIRARGGGRSLLDMGPGRNVPYVPAAALIVRRELAHFDERLRYGEDVELVRRLRAAGHRVVYEPDVVVEHDERHRLRRRFWYGTSAPALSVRHMLVPRTHPFRAARELRRRGLPGRLALGWTARAWWGAGKGVVKLVGPYGLGVAYGRIRAKIGGSPTI
jgi:mycofactocin glycosyltransferase